MCVKGHYHLLFCEMLTTGFFFAHAVQYGTGMSDVTEKPSRLCDGSGDKIYQDQNVDVFQFFERIVSLKNVGSMLKAATMATIYTTIEYTS